MASEQSPEREHIMSVAYALLADSAGTSASVTAILARAGLSTRAFYRHFDSRDALLTALFRRDGDRVLQALTEVSAAAGTGRAALVSWIEGMIALCDDPRRRRRAVVLTSEEISRAKGFPEELRRYRRLQEEALTAVLERGLADGTLPGACPATDATQVNAMLQQAMARRMSDPTAGQDPATAPESILDFALRALTGP